MKFDLPGDSLLLVLRNREDVRETTTASERSSRDLVALDVGAGRQVGRTNGGNEGAHGSALGGEDLSLLATDETLASVATSDTTVTRGEHHGGSLETELHEFVALSLEVLCSVLALGPSVRSRHDIGRCESAAHFVGSLAVENGVVAALGLAVGAVDGVEELVEEALDALVGVEVVVGLVEGGALGEEDGVSHVKVQSGLADGELRVGLLRAEIDEIDLGTVRRRNLRSELGEELGEIGLLVHLIVILEDSQGVLGVGLGALGEVEGCGNAGWCQVVSAVLSGGS